jgi:hypothetical protein
MRMNMRMTRVAFKGRSLIFPEPGTLIAVTLLLSAVVVGVVERGS